MTDALAWTCKVDEIGPHGLSLDRVADMAERQRIAAGLEIVSLEGLHAAVIIRASGDNGRYHMTGELTAQLTQACVVTLEPVKQTITEPIDVALWPAEDIGPLAEGEHSVLEVDVPEPIEHGRIAVGRIIYEHLAAAIDPYPRQPDSSFEGLVHGPRGIGDKPESPFAVLARLKDKDKAGGKGGAKP